MILNKFFFSVLGNGVVSNEFSPMMDVVDDVTRGFFHYQELLKLQDNRSYTGGVFV